MSVYCVSDKYIFYLIVLFFYLSFLCLQKESYITIVVCNRENRYVLFEAYGKNNRKCTEQEMKLINDYCDRHGILRNNYLQMEYNFGEKR